MRQFSLLLTIAFGLSMIGDLSWVMGHPVGDLVNGPAPNAAGVIAVCQSNGCDDTVI